MLKRNFNLVLSLIILVFCMIFVLNLVSALECWSYNADKTTCNNAGCVWVNDNRSDSTIDVYDPMCNIDDYCCMEDECWQYDGQNSSNCTANAKGLNCSWDPYIQNYHMNGTLISVGGCFRLYDTSTQSGWDGASEGCWQYDGDKATCTNSENSGKCEWNANDLNQNPWCWIKTLSDAQNKNSGATSADIGCCEMSGCSSYDGNQTQCLNTVSLLGLCEWIAVENDTWCSDSVGCCHPKWCNQMTNHTQCSKMKTDLYIPCNWTGDSATGSCSESGGSGFYFYNDSDSCMSMGGWWNASNDCEMPTDVIAGGGGFMFAEDAHCWFADNQQSVCGNISGCIYCNDTGVHFGNGGNASAGNMSGTNNHSSACFGMSVGLCQGHQDFWTNYDSDGNTHNVSDISTDPLNCTHIQLRSACNYGPLPNCIWTNTSSITGQFCTPGTSSAVKEAPPVAFCDHPDAKNDYSMCTNITQKFMMPCKWANASINSTNCTFNSNAVFGASATGEKEYEIITSDMACVAAGGTWNTEYYVESGILKQDAWCEKGALYDLATQTAAANKGNCDTDCWACEFNTTGGAHNGSATVAEAACYNSVLGYCRWTNDTNAPNGFGWCDYPSEMDYGAGDCNSKCSDCDLMQTTKNDYDSCLGSIAGCKWVNDSNSTGSFISTGYCVSNTKKICDTDCYSCYDYLACNASSIKCRWDPNILICKPASSASMEICFDGADNDGDSMIDCGDPDCSFDTSCGGNSFGDCSKYTTNATCTNNISFGDQNCTWINNSWEITGHCAMPGENCWQFDHNMTLCGLQPGCTNDSTTSFSGFCDLNITKERAMDCNQYTTQNECNGYSGYNATTNCTWVVSEYGEPHCEYWFFHECNSYGNDSTSCNLNTNCSWNSYDERCEMGCFNFSISDAATCAAAVPRGMCEFRSGSDMCVPDHFQLIGHAGGGGGATGCSKYNGNASGCRENNYSCTWINDSTVDNNVVDGVDGWCESTGAYDLSGDIKGAPIILGTDTSDDSKVTGRNFVNILDFGLRVTDNAYGFGMRLQNFSEAALCNGFPLSQGGVGSGINTTKFYWYLDTDGDTSATSADCVVYDQDNTDVGNGYNFYISHITQNTTSGINIKKQLYRCVQNTTSSWNWVPTNAFVSDDRKFSCFGSGMSVAFVTIEKESLNNFPKFNISEPMRIFAVSATDTYTGSGTGGRTDSIGPEYYTPGTIDFEFVDCSNPDTQDPKCKSFQKFGYNMFEDCKNGVDDDSNGLVDCSDPLCTYTPVCVTGTAFNFVADADDHKSPIVVFSKVDRMADAALITFDTDEPANGTLFFYNQSTTCGGLNATLFDLGDPTLSFDDYKPFHKIILNSDSLGYGLINATNYFYKVKVCDVSDNCGTSKCLNFTTKTVNKNFIFRLDVPDGYTVDIPALSYSGNFTLKEGTKVYDVGLKTNSTESKNMNITVNYSDLSLKLVGVDLYKPKVLNLETSFIADTDDEVIGMNSSTKGWHNVLNDLGLGGANDYIELKFPVAYSSSNTLQWYDDNQANGSAVTDYTNCSGVSSTTCKIPTSLGFSTYTITAPGSSSSTSTSSSGGGSGDVVSWVTKSVVTEDEFVDGYLIDLAANQRVKLEIEGVEHFIGLTEVTDETATISVTDLGLKDTIKVGDTAKFDTNEDGFYDVSVILGGISDNKASLTITSIYEEIPEEELEVGEPEEEKIPTYKEIGEMLKDVPIGWWGVLIVVIILIIIGIIWGTVWKKKDKKNARKRVLVKADAFEKKKKK